jgi:putative membrane protein
MFLWLKWLHIIAVISWMCGILYLYRLLIYHSKHGRSSEDVHSLLGVMAFRLFNYITLPAMAVAWLAGIGMIAVNPQLFSGQWLLLKLLFVFGLTGVTMFGGDLARRFREKQSEVPSETRLRVLNEVPTLLMMIIVWLVLFKPF